MVLPAAADLVAYDSCVPHKQPNMAVNRVNHGALKTKASKQLNYDESLHHNTWVANILKELCMLESLFNL